MTLLITLCQKWGMCVCVYLGGQKVFSEQRGDQHEGEGNIRIGGPLEESPSYLQNLFTNYILTL
jgi:hypothetical protein